MRRIRRMDMTEGTAHFTFAATCGLATFAGAASIILGMEQVQVGAAVFLSLALIGCVVTLASYNMYTQLRNERWRRELKASEDRMSQVFNHARMSLIVDQIGGPSAEEMLDGGTIGALGSGGDAPREGTVANS